MEHHLLISLTLILAVGILCQWLAWKISVPAILPLLLAGIVLGPVTGYLDPDALLGDLFFPFVSLGVAIILFEGSLTLKLDEVRKHGTVVRNLVTLGALTTMVLSAILVRFVFDFPWEIAFLAAAILVVTGPTVIAPLLRSVRPKRDLANILRWEGVLIDPIGALLAVLVFDLIVSLRAGGSLGHFAFVFLELCAAGTVIGLLAGQFIGVCLKKGWIPFFLRDVVTLMSVLAAFTLADVIAAESGLLAVTLMGVRLANMRDVHTEDISEFKESLSILLISLLFIILAARLDAAVLFDMLLPAGIVLAGLTFLVRPCNVLVSAIGSKLSGRDKLFLSWIAPRGIVAAAVASVFAVRLSELGYGQADALIGLTFLIIIGTVFVQSLTAKPAARLLRVAEPKPDGVMIVGAETFARRLAKSLQELGVRVLLVGRNWEGLRRARLEGFETYFGNPLSHDAELNLETSGFGSVLALSHDSTLNAMVFLRFRQDVGVVAIFELLLSEDTDSKHSIGSAHRGLTLFGAEVTQDVITRWLNRGAEFQTTEIGEEFDLESYLSKGQDQIMPLYTVNSAGKVRFFTAGDEVSVPDSGHIVSLAFP